jgi:hypothetical protein
MSNTHFSNNTSNYLHICWKLMFFVAVMWNVKGRVSGWTRIAKYECELTIPITSSECDQPHSDQLNCERYFNCVLFMIYISAQETNLQLVANFSNVPSFEICYNMKIPKSLIKNCWLIKELFQCTLFFPTESFEFFLTLYSWILDRYNLIIEQIINLFCSDICLFNFVCSLQKEF